MESSSLWPVVIRSFSAGGMTDVYAGSGDVSLEIGDVVTMDLILLCDE